MAVCYSLVFILFLSSTRYFRNILIAGGLDRNTYDDILEYNPEDDAMRYVGKMTRIRAGHAVSVVEAQDFDGVCSKNLWKKKESQ